MRYKTYRISGTFPKGLHPEGYNVFNYLPEGAEELVFGLKSAAIQWAKAHSIGPDIYGIEPTWTAKEIIQ